MSYYRQTSSGTRSRTEKCKELGRSTIPSHLIFPHLPRSSPICFPTPVPLPHASPTSYYSSSSPLDSAQGPNMMKLYFTMAKTVRRFAIGKSPYAEVSGKVAAAAQKWSAPSTEYFVKKSTGSDRHIRSALWLAYRDIICIITNGYHRLQCSYFNFRLLSAICWCLSISE